MIAARFAGRVPPKPPVSILPKVVRRVGVGGMMDTRFTQSIGLATSIMPVLFIVHFIPRTSALGGLVLTGHLGFTLAAPVSAPGPTATTIVFPVYVAALLWGGLLLRKARWRMLIPSIHLTCDHKVT